MNCDNRKRKVTRLRYMRLEKGLSAYDLSCKSGVSDKTIFRIEGRTLHPSRKTAIKLCNALNIDRLKTDLTELVEVDANWITDGRTKTFE